MLRILKELCLSKKTASIYTNYNTPTKFYYGVVLAVNDEEIAIYMISTDGKDDGIVAQSIDDVIRVELDGLYEEKMRKLCSINPPIDFDVTLDNNNIIKSLLDLALETKKIVSIELVDSGYDDVVGFVDEIDNGRCKIKVIDEYGYEDGYSYFLIKDVTQVSYATETEKRILNLWDISDKSL